jgi:hypothetical protein
MLAKPICVKDKDCGRMINFAKTAVLTWPPGGA